jgi:hypothetical protein
MVPSHPTRVKFLFCLDPARWRAGPLAPQSHFAVRTIDYVCTPEANRNPSIARGQSCQCPEVYRTTNRPGQEPYRSQRAEGGPPCPQLGREPPAGPTSQEDAKLYEWILDQVRAAFRLRGWEEDERKAERLAQPVSCAIKEGGASTARCRPSAGQRPREVSAAECDSVGAAVDAAAVGRRARNKPGMCPKING